MKAERLPEARVLPVPRAQALVRALVTSRRRREPIQAWMLVGPALLALVFLRIYPIGTALIDSFEGPHGGFTLSNYTYLFGSPDFLQSFKITLIFNAVVNPFQLMVALALAILLTRKVPGRSIWRTLIFAPVAMPLPVSAVVWNQLLAQNGFVNGILTALDLPAQGFLTSQNEALASIVILASWIGCGIWMVFLIAGVQDIPPTLYDAALVDGAGQFQSFRHITLPLLRRPMAFVLVADTVANLLLFAPVQILTQGGPLNATNVAMYDIYNQALLNGATDVASAEMMVLLLITVVVVVVQFHFLRPKV
jgi:multiple sugar transport system permease protein